MSHPIYDAFAGLLEKARTSEPTLDPEPVLHALGYALVLEAIGELKSVDESDRAALVALGRSALERADLFDLESVDEDDADFLDEAIPIARAGYALLRGEPAGAGRVPYERVRPSPARMLEALRGDLPGVEAGRLAARFLREGDGALLDAHRMRERIHIPEESSVRLAAASAEKVRDPREGRRVHYDEARGVEVVLFDRDATLAAYAEADYVALVGGSLEPIVSQAGYTLARLTSRGAIQFTLKVGDEELEISVDVARIPRG